VLTVGAVGLGCYGLVRCAEALRSSRAELIADAADYNARMAAQGRPHTWIVPAPSRTECVIYAVADRLSVRRARRRRTAASVRAAMGGGQ